MLIVVYRKMIDSVIYRGNGENLDIIKKLFLKSGLKTLHSTVHMFLQNFEKMTCRTAGGGGGGLLHTDIIIYFTLYILP